MAVSGLRGTQALKYPGVQVLGVGRIPLSSLCCARPGRVWLQDRVANRNMECLGLRRGRMGRGRQRKTRRDEGFGYGLGEVRHVLYKIFEGSSGTQLANLLSAVLYSLFSCRMIFLAALVERGGQVWEIVLIQDFSTCPDLQAPLCSLTLAICAVAVDRWVDGKI
jgi:hypothetical protein